MSNSSWGEMKKLFWFSIGFCLPFICFNLAYAVTQCFEGETTADWNSYLQSRVDYYESLYPAYDFTVETWSGDCSGCVNACNVSAKIVTLSHGVYHCDTEYICGVIADSSPTDSDSDGIPDGLDAYPDTDSAYQFRIMSNYFDSQGNCVAQLIVTSDGDYILLGDLTADEIEAGVSAGTYTSTFVNSPNWINSSDLKEDDAKDIYSNGQSTKKVTSTEAGGLNDQASEGTKADTPTIGDVPPSTGSEDGDSDSDSWRKIVGNSDSSNKNLEKIGQYLGIGNDLLAKIEKGVNGSGSRSGEKSGTPTADEIGQAVEDELIDPSQTIDTTITDNISDLDETETLTAIKTKYSERYDLFITTLKESDLFSLPFDIFTGPSGSGSSIQTVDIGKWGSSSEQTASIDYSDYDNIWQILRSVLLLVTSFACFKILVLKKG
ncbi:hypothetical protein [Desulfobacter curvatus]|uniref:hypothetical protein n=1 Tax=Desulfobacter curvatus TaxID=2290 RepID=UPI0003774B71|nr:hypothetical protein [Desulfobacter curvatus]